MKIATTILSKPLPMALLAFAVSLIISVFIFLLPAMHTSQRSQYYEIYNRAAEKQSTVERALYARVNLNQALASHIEHNPNITQEEFSTFVSSLLRYEGGVVSSMSFEKDMIITRIAPFEFNKKALGLDLTIDTVRKAGLERCVKERKAYIEGPRELAQDNLGIVSYIPILQKDAQTGQETVLGVADVVILWERFLEKTGLSKDDKYLDIALKGRHGSGEKGEVFYGDSTLFSKENVIKIPIKLHLGEWVLAAYPKAGWNMGVPARLLISCLLTAISLGLIVYFILSYRLKLLATEESKLKFITENSNDVIWIMDYKNLKYKYVSNSVIKLLGWTVDEFLTGQVINLLGTDNCTKFTNKLNQIIEYNNSSDDKQTEILSECQIPHKDGSLIWIETTASLITNSLNEFEIVGRFHNITQRKLAEQRLIEQLTELSNSENKYRLIVDNSKDMIWVWSLEHKNWLFISPSCYNMTGFTVEEMIVLPIEKQLPDGSIEILNSAFATEINKYNLGIVSYVEIVFEMQRFTKNGNSIWVEVSAEGITDDSGNIVKIIGIERLIGKRKNIEISLQESEKQFHFITDNLPDVIWIVDANTLKFIFITENCIHLTGYSKAEYLNMSLFDNITPETSGKALPILKDAIKSYKKSLKPVEVVFEVQRSSNHTNLQRWIEISAVVTTKSNDNMVIIGTSRFINERKKVEFQEQRQYSELQENVARLQHILKHANDLVWTMDIETMRYTYVNEGCYKNTGFTKEEHEKITIYEAMPPVSSDIFTQTLSDAMEQYKRNNKPVEAVFEVQRYRKDGPLTWVEISITATADFTELVGIERMIDTRKRAEFEIMRLQQIQKINDAFK